ncbi:helix-turn-helix domain-containing protein, partial [Nocardia niigatensis]
CGQIGPQNGPMDTSADLDQAQIDNTRRVRVAAGNKLRGLRAERRLTQQQLADLLGWNKKTVQRFENGEREMDMSQIWAVAKALGTTPTAFTRDIEDAVRAMEREEI